MPNRPNEPARVTNPYEPTTGVDPAEDRVQSMHPITRTLLCVLLLLAGLAMSWMPIARFIQLELTNDWPVSDRQRWLLWMLLLTFEGMGVSMLVTMLGVAMRKPRWSSAAFITLFSFLLLFAFGAILY